MGLLRFITRIGAVGGTARAIARQYKHLRRFRSEDDGIEECFVFTLILEERFPSGKRTEEEDILLDNVDKIKGLKELVIEILTIESGYMENTFETQLMFDQIIEEELLKKGIDKIKI